MFGRSWAQFLLAGDSDFFLSHARVMLINLLSPNDIFQFSLKSGQLRKGLIPTNICFYLSELLRYSNSPRLLRSSSQNFLAVPRSRSKTYGDRAFSVVAPKLWNQLPPEVRGVTSVDQFRKHLKTYLFKLAYDV